MTKGKWGSEWPSSGVAIADKQSCDDAEPNTRWPIGHTGKEIAEQQKQQGFIEWPKEAMNKILEEIPWPKTPVLTGLDIATGERTILTTFENDGIKYRVISQTELKQGFNDPAVSKVIDNLVEANYDTSKLKSQGSNLVDDQAYLYFQCEGCNEILDPHTKSFAKLQEHRVNAGWKCVWNLSGFGYQVYCEKCGEKVK